MRILSLVEDWTARDDLKRTHGMCLYIQTAQHKILFDVGPDDTFMQNAEACGIDLKAVDTIYNTTMGTPPNHYDLAILQNN